MLCLSTLQQPMIPYGIVASPVSFWGLFKKSPSAIFVCETNLNPLWLLLFLERSFLVSFLFPPFAVRRISELVSPTKIAYSDFLKRSLADHRTCTKLQFYPYHWYWITKQVTTSQEWHLTGIKVLALI